MAHNFKPRYGLSSDDIMSLLRKWDKYIKNDTMWTEEEFLVWAASVERIKNAQIRRYNEANPYSSENAFFYKAAYRPRKPVKNVISPFCVGCKRTCPGNGDGCNDWESYYKEHLDRCIHWKEGDTPKWNIRQSFRYVHPDTKV